MKIISRRLKKKYEVSNITVIVKNKFPQEKSFQDLNAMSWGIPNKIFFALYIR